MDYHGLTDRMPTTHYLTTAPPAEWRMLAQERMRKDLGKALHDYQEAGFPILHRPRFKTIERHPVHVTQRRHAGAYVVTAQGHIRVSSIGHTFLEMIQNPELCGGIRHVIAVFQHQGAKYLPLILADVDQHGSGIDKVRVGYLLEELGQLSDPVLERWQRSVVQRGGSRKLDAHAPYAPTYSERWCLSLNHI
jgi:predicted transcriptional regulator of viral defense system